MPNLPPDEPGFVEFETVNPTLPKVPVGPTTVAGYSVSLAAFALAVLAFLEGDRSEQTIGVIVAGVIGALSFVVTQIGRYVQAREIAKRAAAPPVYSVINTVKSVDLGESDNDVDEDALEEAHHRIAVLKQELERRVEAEKRAEFLGDVAEDREEYSPPDLNDKVHALTEGDARARVDGERIDEQESAPDPAEDPEERR